MYWLSILPSRSGFCRRITDAYLQLNPIGAAQQKVIYFALFPLIVCDGPSNESMVAEAIAHPNRKYLPLRLLCHLRNLWFGVASRGQVELVGLLSQLCNPRQRQA